MTGDALVLSFGLYLAGGTAGLALGFLPRLALRAGAAGAVAGAAAGLWAVGGVLLGGPPVEVQARWAVPAGSLHLVIDPLSAVFLVPLFALSALFAVYGIGYLEPYAGRRRLGGQVFFYNLLCVSMALVVAARDGVLLLVAWEAMSLASFFLVAFEDERADVREASRIYLIATHLGAAFLVLFVALWGRDTGSFVLERAGAGVLSPGTTAVLLGLALVGFGTKAGLWPLHVWLPKAHPAAPSHVSALLSGVMLKTGVYGIFRTLWLLGPVPAPWALLLLAAGAASGLLGILSALGQKDLKALLAYSSGENVGVILLGAGVGALGTATGQPFVAAAGYAGAFLHVWNHGLFKGLLFLGAGSVVHAARSRNMEHLGGLARRMPWTAAFFLAGCAAIAGLPPFNGLASEWLIYGALFRAGVDLPGAFGLAGLGAAAALALVGGLALAAFAKAAGTVFLGESRTEAARGAHEAGVLLLLPMGMLAVGCLAVGLAPAAFAGLLAGAAGQMDPQAAAVFPRVASWTAPLARLGWVSAGAAALAAALLGLRAWLLRGSAVGVSPTWDCGYAGPTARMQYTGSSLAEPGAALFRAVLRPDRALEPPSGFFPRAGRFASAAPDLAETSLWEPLFARTARALSALRFLQGGRLQHYLLFLLIALLVLVGWALFPA